jgi:hypothetical protein
VRDDPGFVGELPQEFRIDFAAGAARASGLESLRGAAEEATAEIASFFPESKMEMAVAGDEQPPPQSTAGDALKQIALMNSDIANAHAMLADRVRSHKGAKAVADFKVGPKFPNGSSI